MSHSRKSLLAAASLALAVLVVPLAAPPPPASADTASSPCPNGALCLFKDPNYRGAWSATSGNDSNYADNMFTYCFWACELNDSVSSIDNDRKVDSQHYVHRTSFSGPNYSFRIKAGGYRATLVALFDDDLSAHRFASS